MAFLSLLICAAVPLAACGSRSDLQDLAGAGASGGQGGSAGAAGSPTTSAGGGTTTSTGSTGGDAPFDCAGLSLAEGPVPAPSPGFARAPRIALLAPPDPQVLLFLDAPVGEAGTLQALRMNAFEDWPPTFDGVALIDDDVPDYVAGPGPKGPVGLLRHSGGQATIAMALYPMIESVEPSLGSGDALLFAAGIPDRTFVGQSYPTPQYDVLDLGSYQTGSLPQGNQPIVCLTSPVLAAAVPSGTGFLAAITEPSPPLASCDSAAPHAGTSVSVSRYEAPPGSGSSLERKEGLRLENGEPAVRLAIAGTPSGGWVVFQTDGSTARVPPPIVAARVDAAGNAVTPGQLVPVSPGGQIVPAMAVAGLGDGLAVAWVDALDPSAPVILVQLVAPDGTLGALMDIQTNALWYGGGLRLLASPANDSLLVAWETLDLDGRIALARLDCLNTF